MATAVDRTHEFNEICSFLGATKRATLAKTRPETAKNRAGGETPQPPKAEVASLADFHQAASSISQEIFTTSQKLNELTKLVRDSSRSLFNDPSEKIASYVHSISEDLGRLNGKLESAQAYVDQKRATLNGGGNKRKSQIADHSVSVVSELKASLVHATKAFKVVVQQRTDSVKAQEERKKEFGRPAASSSRLQRGRPKVYGLPDAVAANAADGAGGAPGRPGGGGGGGGGGALPRPGQQHGGGLDVYLAGGGGGYEGASSSSSSSGMVRRPQQAQALQPLIPDNSYYESREEAVTAIEAHIMELGSVFGKLGELVADHQELTERLHDNTMVTVENVNMGHNRLMRTMSQLTSGRSLALKLSGVLFSFLVFFIIFLA